MKTILVVEDDPLNLQILTDFLAAHGYRIRGAQTGPEGVESFRAARPDLMLIDIQLPRKNGFEVCFEVRQEDAGRDLPVLLMSAVYTDTEHALRYSEQGLRADGYVTKPFELSALLEKVRGLIGEA